MMERPPQGVVSVMVGRLHVALHQSSFRDRENLLLSAEELQLGLDQALAAEHGGSGVDTVSKVVELGLVAGSVRRYVTSGRSDDKELDSTEIINLPASHVCMQSRQQILPDLSPEVLVHSFDSSFHAPLAVTLDVPMYKFLINTVKLVPTCLDEWRSRATRRQRDLGRLRSELMAIMAAGSAHTSVEGGGDGGGSGGAGRGSGAGWTGAAAGAGPVVQRQRVFTIVGDPAVTFRLNPKLAVVGGITPSVSWLLNVLGIQETTAVMGVVHDSIGGSLESVLASAEGALPSLRWGQSTEVFFEPV